MARGYDDEIHITNVSPEIVTRWNVMLQRRGVDPSIMFETMVRSFDRGPVKYHRDDVINFGKYSGMNVEDVIRSDPRYMRWLVNTSEWFRLGGDAMDVLQEVEG